MSLREVFLDICFENTALLELFQLHVVRKRPVILPRIDLLPELYEEDVIRIFCRQLEVIIEVPFLGAGSDVDALLFDQRS